jgi:hypothetical protein
MGLEAECTVRLGRKSSTGKALLEGDKLVFTGEFRLSIPIDQIRRAAVDNDALVVQTGDQEARLELGPTVAERWARLITEPKELFEKLELRPDSRVAVVDVGDSLFVTALRERLASVAEGRVPGGTPVVFFGAETADALRKLQLLLARMMDTGVLWVVRPKGARGLPEAEVMAAIRGAGLVDTKVVAFSRTHTAHKCVIPVERRGGAPRPRPPVVSIPPSAPSLGGRGKAPARGKAGSPKAAKPAAKAVAKPAGRAVARAAGRAGGSVPPRKRR